MHGFLEVTLVKVRLGSEAIAEEGRLSTFFNIFRPGNLQQDRLGRFGTFTFKIDK